jgi:hypothetical protein
LKIVTDLRGLIIGNDGKVCVKLFFCIFYVDVVGKYRDGQHTYQRNGDNEDGDLCADFYVFKHNLFTV